MEQDRQLVVKSNHIIEASYRLSVAEQRVILSAISQVRRDQHVTDAVLYSVTAAEVAELCGTDPKTAYRDLQSAAERLQTRRVTLLLEPDGITIRSKRKRVTCWVQTVDYIDQEGRIELRFGKDILPYLTGLQREFTRYALSDVAKMTSAHGIRLYELLVQWPEGHRVVALDDLRRWLQLEDRYPLMADLRRWVIEPAVEQINEHSPLSLTWSQRKTGRKVTHLVFDYAPKKPAKALRKAPGGAQAKRKGGRLTDEEIARQARPGESWEAARARLNQIQLELA
jgi:plasmid replication initiation protein